MPVIDVHHRLGVLALVSGMALSGGAVAAEGEDSVGQGLTPAADNWIISEPDTSAWRCRLCPFPSGWTGFVDLGGGYVSDDSLAFGDYRGLENEGFFSVAGGELRYRDEDADHFELTADELALDSRSLRMEGGRQGSYALHLDYRELPHYRGGEARTVFSTGSSNLMLPPGWVRDGSTGGMTALDNSLRDVTIGLDRESLGIGLDLLQKQQRWRYSLDYRQDTREGAWMRGGSFLFRSTQLAMPVDDKTERMDASVAYVRDSWQLKAAYHASLFTNNHDALTWDNPFTSSNGADRGRAATEPDNQFHRMMLSGGWRSGQALNVAGRLAIGRMEQDEDFLPATINSGIAAPALPDNSLDGEVDTRQADLRITGNPGERVTARLELSHDERDNQTPRNAYTQVATDEVIGDVRTNRPYSFETNKAELGLDYRVTRNLKLSGAAERKERERSFQEIEQSDTDTYWLEVQGSPTARLNVSLRQTLEERRGSHEPLGLMPPEHTGLRKFHLANRERDASSLRLDFMPTSTVSLGLVSRNAVDDYTDSEAGLTDARDQIHSFNVSVMPTNKVRVSAYFSLQSTESDIHGNDNLTGAAWQGQQDDSFRTLGLGLQLDDLPGRFTEGGIDITYANGTTETRVDKAGVTAPSLRDLESRFYTVNFFVERELLENAALRLEYLLEGFREDDYQRDGVSPDTIPTVLALSGEAPDYSVHVVRAAFRYRF